MIHYHGGPITPETCAIRCWSGRHAFVAFDHKSGDGRDIGLAADVCQSFALDNGAFTAWKSQVVPSWPAFYDWAEQWLSHPACDWAVIPDVIGGGEEENDALVRAWPFGFSGVPVWHLNESPERLQRLADDWPRVALGSAAEWDVKVPRSAIKRLADVLPAISDERGRPNVKLHGLRMLNPKIITRVPLSSGDSTNVARNIGMDKAWAGRYAPATKEARVDVLAERIERHQSPDHLIWFDAGSHGDDVLDFGGAA